MNADIPALRATILERIRHVLQLQDESSELQKCLYIKVKKLVPYIEGKPVDESIGRLMQQWSDAKAICDLKDSEIEQATKALCEAVHPLRAIRTEEINVRIEEFRNQIAERLMPLTGNDLVLSRALPRFFPVVLDLQERIAWMDFAADQEAIRYARTVLADVDKPMPALFDLGKEELAA